MNWISVVSKMPETQDRVLVYWKNSYDRARISCAEYIAPKTVLAEDFLDPEFSEDFAEYDEIKDCYWTPDGFYESNYESDVNYLITDEVTHWMPLPKATETTASPSETAAVQGILTEEELKDMEFIYGLPVEGEHKKYGSIARLIASHKALFSANAELSFNLNRYRTVALKFVPEESIDDHIYIRKVDTHE